MITIAPTLIPFVVVMLVVAAALFILGVRRMRHRRLASGGGMSVTGVLLLALVGIVSAVLLNLHTYQRLTHEQLIATLTFERLADQQYRVRLERPDFEARLYELTGDEWQLDARVLKWHGIATLAGLDTLYRLERLGGRYRDVMQETNGERRVYQLSDSAGLDLWVLARRHRDWVPWVDAVYGSATYLPMQDGARYGVYVSTTGLLARPLNADAQSAVRQW